MTEKQQSEAAFSLEKIYVKDASFEAPNVPAVFLDAKQPQLDVKLEIEHTPLEQNMFEVVMPLSVTAKVDDTTWFLAEVHQAGVFHIQGIGADDLPVVLEINCPNILLPFAREAIASMVGRGGFPPILVNPVNFEMLYHQRHDGAAAGSGKPS